ncbi:MAG: tRNA (guanosine(46)-N7)-methyltransferase TrmB, partial [Notoacmeibacter sp.]
MPIRPTTNIHLSGGLFGRRIGNVLSPAQTADFDKGLAVYGLEEAETRFAEMSSLFAAPVDHFHLEIGFGSGEHLLASARREASTGFI